MLPRGVEGLWVVGRSAGYDPIAQSSARAVPFGMAMGEAAGVAAAWGVARGLSPRETASTGGRVAAVRTRLLNRGAVLPDVAERPPAGPADHPHYGAYREMVRWGLAVGGYGNDPGLDVEVTPTSLLYLLANVGQRVLAAPDAGRRVIDRVGLPGGALDPAQAASIVGAFLAAAGRPLDAPDAAVGWDALNAAGLAVADPGRALRRGEVYALAVWVVARGGER